MFISLVSLAKNLDHQGFFKEIHFKKWLKNNNNNIRYVNWLKLSSIFFCLFESISNGKTHTQIFSPFSTKKQKQMKRNHHKNAIKKPPSNNDNIYLSPPPNIYVKKPNMKKNWFKLQVFNRQFVCLEEEKRKIIDTIDYHYFLFFFRILFSKACYISFIIHNDFPLFFVFCLCK